MPTLFYLYLGFVLNFPKGFKMKQFLNNKGFTLISVIIGIGLLSALVVAVMQVIGNISNAQVRANSLADEIEMKTSIRMILDNPKFCKISFAGEDPVSSPILFEKKDIDFSGVNINAGSSFSETSEGLNVELWYSDTTASTRTLKKFNGADNPGADDKSKYGNLKINSMKLVMSNGLGACSENYCPGDVNDTGQLVVLYEKKISQRKIREMKTIFDINLGISTQASGESSILSCHRISTGTLPGYEIVSNSMTNSAHYNVDALCPTGKKVISGGCSQGDVSISTAITDNHPLGQTGWHCRTRDVDTPTLRTTTAYAICVDDI